VFFFFDVKKKVSPSKPTFARQKMTLTPKKINTGILSIRLNKNKVCQLGIVFASNQLVALSPSYLYTYSYIHLYFKTSYKN